MPSRWTYVHDVTSMLFAVANLPHRTDRWATTSRALGRAGVLPMRVDAMDGSAARMRYPIAGTVSTGNAGLIGTFLDLLETSSSKNAEWLIFLEDDVLLFPFFRRRADHILQSVGSDIMAVQLGWITRVPFSSQASLLRNLLVHGVRPRKRLRRAVQFCTDGVLRDVMRHEWRNGTHAVAVRTSTHQDLAAMLHPYDQPLDVLFIRAASRHPSRFHRPRVSLATQRNLPSDISPQI